MFFVWFQDWLLRSYCTLRVSSRRRTWRRRWHRCTSCVRSSCRSRTITTSVCVRSSRCSSWRARSSVRTPTRTRTSYCCAHSGTPTSQSSWRTIPSFSRCACVRVGDAVLFFVLFLVSLFSLLLYVFKSFILSVIRSFIVSCFRFLFSFVCFVCLFSCFFLPFFVFLFLCLLVCFLFCLFVCLFVCLFFFLPSLLFSFLLSFFLSSVLFFFLPSFHVIFLWEFLLDYREIMPWLMWVTL